LASVDSYVYFSACDSAKPDFAGYDADVDPKDAAQNVQCIHTSAVLGTDVYQCDQNWLMGMKNEHFSLMLNVFLNLQLQDTVA
jgi:hypothetical protein